ncbi:MAG: hypothetical protein K2L93_08760 [Muribaculaceae bacterium]|nr:hypothetical protein [Muribaculaceae bacterium]MDE6322374.1 hypothetical protein [Muribaculaceae bacterium]
MAKQPDILTKIDRRTGMTVPDGYFDDFVKRMQAQLPELEATAAARKPAGGIWYTIRPYVYMAAMFAGIWCMLHIFNIMGSNDVDLSIESHPAVAEALSNDTFVEEYILPSYSESDLYLQLYESGVTVDDLQESADEFDDIDYIFDDIDYADIDGVIQALDDENTDPSASHLALSH